MIFQYAIDQPFNFCVIGVSHWNAPVEVREQFSLTEQKIRELLSEHKSHRPSCFILSTCNRTEIYAFGGHCMELIDYLTQQEPDKALLFEQYGYVKRNHEAIRHLFAVSAGLDSQILGDFQVMGQIRSAYQIAQEAGTVNAELNRLMMDVFRTSKRIRTETNINVGASSTAYAAVKHIREQFSDLQSRKVLLYGVGKIGKIICSNLTKSIPHQNITVINRTYQRAQEVAESFEIIAQPIEALQEQLDQADIVVVATGAKKPVLTQSSFLEASLKKEKYLLDLSVPRNIDPGLESIDAFKVVNLDHLSDIKNKDVHVRKQDIPFALQIIHEAFFEYYHWLELRKYAPTIHALKEKLEDFKVQEIERVKKTCSSAELSKIEAVTSNIVTKITKQFVNHLKDNLHNSDQSLEALQDIFELEVRRLNE
jgi:glutamyl-tRNA reductase